MFTAWKRDMEMARGLVQNVNEIKRKGTSATLGIEVALRREGFGSGKKARDSSGLIGLDWGNPRETSTRSKLSLGIRDGDLSTSRGTVMLSTARRGLGELSHAAFLGNLSSTHTGDVRGSSGEVRV